jgi:hypothetical protein
VPPEGPARGSRLAGRERVRVSEFVGGTRQAKSVGRGSAPRVEGRGPRTLTQIAHASRDTLGAHATATAHAGRSGLNRKVARPCGPTG